MPINCCIDVVGVTVYFYCFQKSGWPDIIGRSATRTVYCIIILCILKRLCRHGSKNAHQDREKKKINGIEILIRLQCCSDIPHCNRFRVYYTYMRILLVLALRDQRALNFLKEISSSPTFRHRVWGTAGPR